MATKNDEKKRDETPTRLKHDNGTFVTVPAYKVDGLVGSGLFAKASAKK